MVPALVQMEAGLSLLLGRVRLCPLKRTRKEEEGGTFPPAPSVLSVSVATGRTRATTSRSRKPVGTTCGPALGTMFTIAI